MHCDLKTCQLNDPTVDNECLILSPIYSIFDQESDTVTAPGRLAPILKCLVAFACSNLEGFEVPEPSVQVSPRQPPLDEDEEENSNECKDGFHSISSNLRSDSRPF